MSHTPGPWRADKTGGTAPEGWLIVALEGEMAWASVTNGTVWLESDARLIAAAPDLLRALEQLCEAEQTWAANPGKLTTRERVKAYDDARVAIAEAKGES